MATEPIRSSAELPSVLPPVATGWIGEREERERAAVVAGAGAGGTERERGGIEASGSTASAFAAPATPPSGVNIGRPETPSSPACAVCTPFMLEATSNASWSSLSRAPVRLPSR